MTAICRLDFDLILFKLMLKQKDTSSEMSGGNTVDIKYQKAIKEIGKLVNINTALKKEAVAMQERYDNLRSDY